MPATAETQIYDQNFMRSQLILLGLFITLLSCDRKVSSADPGGSIHKTSSKNDSLKFVYQVSKDKDSVVLVKYGDYPFFEKVQIFHEQKKILDYSEDGLAIMGSPSNFFVEVNEGKGQFYILRLFNGPSPDKFLVIRNKVILGVTEPNSAEIFGDVDYDGKFEIGGLTAWCPGGDKSCHPGDHYRVFELDDNFPTDKILTDYFKQFLKAR